jgi:ubiquinone/menaquinone biosynthesis C-methylase UbiE
MKFFEDNKNTDKKGYDEYYKNEKGLFADSNIDINEYINYFEQKFLNAFCYGGDTKGYVKGLSTEQLIKETKMLSCPPEEITILDAGCGRGELSTYLACRRFNVIGVDISATACKIAKELAYRIGVSDKCTFLPESLEKISLPDNSIDYIIGHASLHHFIKYENIPHEFYRVMKNNSKGFFAESFGENPLYRIFHDKERMERLGDVVLSRKMIKNYFENFKVDIIPTDWFVMLDKLYLKILPKKCENFFRKISRFHFLLDRNISNSSGIALTLAGSVLVTIDKS